MLLAGDEEELSIPLEGSARRLVSVHLPVVVADGSRGLALFGGPEALRSAAEEVPPPALMLHPEDPSRGTLSAQEAPQKYLVVRVRRRRGAAASAASLGHTVGGLDFQRGLADFHFGRSPGGLQCAPPRLAAKATFAYRFDAHSASGPGLSPAGGGGTKARALRVAFGAPAPSGPAPPDPKRRRRRPSAEREGVRSKILEMLKYRPIWPHRRLLREFDAKERSLAGAVLPEVAFQYAGGPWAGAWVRFGFDARQEDAARLYQSVRVRFSSKVLQGYRQRFARIRVANQDAAQKQQRRDAEVFGGALGLSWPVSVVDVPDRIFQDFLLALPWRRAADRRSGWWDPPQLRAIAAAATGALERRLRSLEGAAPPLEDGNENSQEPMSAQEMMARAQSAERPEAPASR